MVKRFMHKTAPQKCTLPSLTLNNTPPNDETKKEKLRGERRMKTTFVSQETGVTI